MDIKHMNRAEIRKLLLPYASDVIDGKARNVAQMLGMYYYTCELTENKQKTKYHHELRYSFVSKAPNDIGKFDKLAFTICWIYDPRTDSIGTIDIPIMGIERTYA